MAALYIYRNLRTGGFSVRHRGVVIKRIDTGIASGVLFKVNEKGRQRVLLERQKNVHSFVVAKQLEETALTADGLVEVKYNPYKGCEFTVDGVPVTDADAVFFRGGRCFLIADEKRSTHLRT